MTDDYLGPEPTRDETADQVLGHWNRAVIERDRLKTYVATANRYEAALRKIAAWKGYAPQPSWFESDVPFTDYERGANDMLETLQAMAAEALK